MTFGGNTSVALRLNKCVGTCLVRVLAYTIQERALGGLATRRRIRQLIGENIKNPGAMTLQIKPGTKLIREYQGQMHNVIVAERSYEYQGQLAWQPF